MMQATALTILTLSSIWLMLMGLLMLFHPERCLHILGLTASTHRINLTEQGLRAIAGVALVIRADFSKFPTLFYVGGSFIVVSSLVLMAIPLRWHSGYAIWWAQRLPLWAVRSVGPLSLAAGSTLIWLSI